MAFWALGFPNLFPMVIKLIYKVAQRLSIIMRPTALAHSFL